MPSHWGRASHRPGPSGCGATKCSREVLSIGTPAIWWVSIVTLLVMVGWWLVQRDWRAGAIVAGFLAGWVPWFYFGFGHRTMFLFYARWREITRYMSYDGTPGSGFAWASPADPVWYRQAMDQTKALLGVD